MRKLTVFIEGNEKTVTFDNSLVVTHDTSQLFVKTATVFWNYNNVFKGYNDYITFSGTKLFFKEGYWSFWSIVEVLGKLGVTLTSSKPDGRCLLIVDKELKLHTFGELLGFYKDTILTKATHSPKSVNINNGLLFFSVSCDKVDDTIDTDGKRSEIITTLPIPSTLSNTSTLKGSVTHYVDIESKAPLSKGIYNEITFRVKGNNGHTQIGKVLLDIYIL